ADPQADAAIKIVAWLSAGTVKPAADDFAMLRLVLLALLPQIGGILLMIGRARNESSYEAARHDVRPVAVRPSVKGRTRRRTGHCVARDRKTGVVRLSVPKRLPEVHMVDDLNGTG